MNPATTSIYRENRSKLTLEELEKHNGNWVAFSADGRQIVASGLTLIDVSNQLERSGTGLQEVVFGRIELESDVINLGGAEFL